MVVNVRRYLWRRLSSILLTIFSIMTMILPSWRLHYISTLDFSTLGISNNLEVFHRKLIWLFNPNVFNHLQQITFWAWNFHQWTHPKPFTFWAWNFQLRIIQVLCQHVLDLFWPIHSADVSISLYPLWTWPQQFLVPTHPTFSLNICARKNSQKKAPHKKGWKNIQKFIITFFLQNERKLLCSC